MIITHLIGGLGNQLFQYAAGRRLSVLHNTELKMDITDFDENNSRFYDLKHFNIKENIASRKETLAFKENSLVSQFKTHFIKPKKQYRYFNERHYHFDPEILNLPDNTYLNGYWQSEKYFEDISDIIREEFRFKPLDTRGIDQTLNLIQNSVSDSCPYPSGRLPEKF